MSLPSLPFFSKCARENIRFSFISLHSNHVMSFRRNLVGSKLKRQYQFLLDFLSKWWCSLPFRGIFLFFNQNSTEDWTIASLLLILFLKKRQHRHHKVDDIFDNYATWFRKQLRCITEKRKLSRLSDADDDDNVWQECRNKFSWYLSGGNVTY